MRGVRGTLTSVKYQIKFIIENIFNLILTFYEYRAF